MTTRKKAVAKKKTARKKAVKKKTTARTVKKKVINHDPFSVLEGEETAEQVEAVSQSQEIQPSGTNDEDRLTAKAGQEEADMQEQSTQGDNTDTAKAEVNLGSALTVADAEAQKIELTGMINDGIPVSLNAEDMEQIDGAGLQLLAAFFKEAQQKDLDVSWGSISPVLLDAVKLLCWMDEMKMQESEQDDGEGTAWGLF